MMYGMNFQRAQSHQNRRESRTLNALTKRWTTVSEISRKVFKDDYDPRLVEVRQERVRRELRAFEARGKAESMETPGGTELWRRAR